MRYNDIIEIINVSYIENEIGEQIAVKSKRTIYANRYQISTANYYNSTLSNKANIGIVDLQDSVAYQVRTISLREGDRFIVVNNKEYRLVRVADGGEYTQILGTNLISNDIN